MKRQSFPDKPGYWVCDSADPYKPIQIYYLIYETNKRITFVNMSESFHKIEAKGMLRSDFESYYTYKNPAGWYYIGPFQPEEFRKLYTS